MSELLQRQLQRRGAANARGKRPSCSAAWNRNALQLPRRRVLPRRRKRPTGPPLPLPSALALKRKRPRKPLRIALPPPLQLRQRLLRQKPYDGRKRNELQPPTLRAPPLRLRRLLQRLKHVTRATTPKP